MPILEQLRQILHLFHKTSETTTTATFSAITDTTKFSLSPNNLNEWSESLFNQLIDIFAPILEPVPVSYSNKLLATQIYGLSILLFILITIIKIMLKLYKKNFIFFFNFYN